MRLEISNAIRRDLHDEIRELTELGFRKTRDAGVEIHLRSRPPRPYYTVVTTKPDGTMLRVTCRTKRERDRTIARLTELYGIPCDWMKFGGYRDGMSGRAYSEVPKIARVAPSTRYLITLKIPADPFVAAYPRVLKYPGMKTAPLCAVVSWQECYLHLVAHEARHTYQFDKGKRGSEIDAERWAKKILNEIRDEKLRVPTYEISGRGLGKVSRARARGAWISPEVAARLEEEYRGFGDLEVDESWHAKLLDELRAGV